jgi:hypothetical protein
MSDEAEVSRIILAALENANINFPDLADGTTRDAIYRNTEESEHLGRAVLAALKEAGYEIRKVGKGGPATTDTGGQAQAARSAATDEDDWPKFNEAPAQRER